MAMLAELFNFGDKDIVKIKTNLRYIKTLLNSDPKNVKKEYLPELLGVFNKIAEDPEASQLWCEVMHFFLENNDTIVEVVENNGLSLLVELSGSQNKDVAIAALKEINTYANKFHTKPRDKNLSKPENISKCTAIIQTLFTKAASFDKKGTTIFCDILGNFSSITKIRDYIVSDIKGMEYLVSIIDHVSTKDDLLALALSVLTKYLKTTEPIYKKINDLGAEKKVNELLKAKRCVTSGYAFFRALLSKEAGADIIAEASWPILINHLKEYKKMTNVDLEHLLEIFVNVQANAKKAPSFAGHCDLLLGMTIAKMDTIEIFTPCMKLINTMPETEVDPKTSSHFLYVSIKGLEKYIPKDNHEILIECFRGIRNNMKNNIRKINLEDTIIRQLNGLKDKHKDNDCFQTAYIKGILTLVKCATLDPQKIRWDTIGHGIAFIKNNIVNDPGASDFSAFIKMLDPSKDLTQEDITIAEPILVKVFNTDSDMQSLKQLIKTKEGQKNFGEAIVEIFNKCTESGKLKKLFTEVADYDECIRIAFENVNAPHFFELVYALMKEKPKRNLPEAAFEQITDAMMGAKTTELYQDYIYLLWKTTIPKECDDSALPFIDKITEYTCSIETKNIKHRDGSNINMKNISLNLLRKLMGAGGKICERFIKIDGIKKVNNSIPPDAPGILVEVWLDVLRQIILSKTMKSNLISLFKITFERMKFSSNVGIQTCGCNTLNTLASTHPEIIEDIASEELFELISGTSKKTSSKNLLGWYKKLLETLFSDHRVKEKRSKYVYLLTELTESIRLIESKEPPKQLPRRFSDSIVTDPSFTFKTILLGIKGEPPSLKKALSEAKLKNFEDTAKECLEKVQEVDVNDEMFASLTPDEKGAIFAYTLERADKFENIYKCLNEAMACRGDGNFKRWKGYIYLLLSALRKCANSYTKGVLYRGIRLDEDAIRKYKAAKEGGTETTWWSFVSTSTELKIANDFTKRDEDGTIGVLFIIKNGNGCMVSKLSNEAEEHEVLLEPERKFRVLEVVEFPEKVIITIEITNPDYHLLDTIK